jgi:hypothetical protein
MLITGATTPAEPGGRSRSPTIRPNPSLVPKGTSGPPDYRPGVSLENAGGFLSSRRCVRLRGRCPLDLFGYLFVPGDFLFKAFFQPPRCSVRSELPGACRCSTMIVCTLRTQ